MQVRRWIPATVHGSFFIAVSFLFLYCPETVGRGLPKTSQEILQWPRTLTKEEALRVKKDMTLKQVIFGKKTKNTQEDNPSTDMAFDNPGFDPEATHL